MLLKRSLADVVCDVGSILVGSNFVIFLIAFGILVLMAAF
jgi:hypothetical protein